MRVTTLTVPERALPMPAQQHPQFRYPSQRSAVPSRCGHCGARLILGDVPTADHPVADASCIYCSRVAAVLIHDTVRRPMTGEEFRALPPVVGQGKRPRGRPPTPPELLKPPANFSCANCETALVRKQGARCHPCLQAYRDEVGQIARLVVALGDGQPRARHALAQELGISYDALRRVIYRAVQAGRPIVNHAQGVVRLQVTL